MSETGNTEVVKKLYAAFSAGDLAGVLDGLAPDVDWAYPKVRDVPFSGSVRGRQEVARFFDALSAAEDILIFQVHEFVGHGDRVLALGSWRSKVKATGRTYETGFIHALTVRAGKLQRYEPFYDTAAQSEAFRP